MSSSLNPPCGESLLGLKFFDFGEKNFFSRKMFGPIESAWIHIEGL